MFTNDDAAFLDRLGRRADAVLGSADATSDQLWRAIAGLRSSLSAEACLDQGLAAEVDVLLDAVWWASSAGDRPRARDHAARLARTVRELRLPGPRAMQVVDAAQQIRTLVVLAA
jgi:hypothetical protein